jgi:hypothetical protein
MRAPKPSDKWRGVRWPGDAAKTTPALWVAIALLVASTSVATAYVTSRLVDRFVPKWRSTGERAISRKSRVARRACASPRAGERVRAEIVRIRASVAPPAAWSRALRIRGPFLLLALAIALQAGFYVRTFYVIRGARSIPTNSTL